MAKKSKTKAEREHLNKVAELCCVACSQIGYPDTPAEIHHIRKGQGMSQRASHFDVIPLCPEHHRTGPHGVALHSGQKAFEEIYGTELELLDYVRSML